MFSLILNFWILLASHIPWNILDCDTTQSKDKNYINIWYCHFLKREKYNHNNNNNKIAYKLWDVVTKPCEKSYNIGMSLTREGNDISIKHSKFQDHIIKIFKWRLFIFSSGNHALNGHTFDNLPYNMKETLQFLFNKTTTKDLIYINCIATVISFGFREIGDHLLGDGSHPWQYEG